MAISIPGPVSSQNRASRARFCPLTGMEMVLPQSPTPSDQLPLYHTAYKHVLVKCMCDAPIVEGEGFVIE